MNEAQELPSRASQIREGGIINMVSANPSCPWASHLNHLFPLQSQSHAVLVRKLNYSFKNLAQMVSLSLSKAPWFSVVCRIKSRLFHLAFRVLCGVDPACLPKPTSPTSGHTS